MNVSFEGVMQLKKRVLLFALFVTCGGIITFFLTQEQRSSRHTMAKLLRTLFENENPEIDDYANKKRVLFFQKKIEKSQSMNEKFLFEFQLAKETLFAGDTTSAIRQFEKLLSLRHDSPSRISGKSIFSEVEYYLGLSYLRLGEQKNCITEHNHDSCIFPIQGHGIHQQREGSQKAAQIFLNILKNDPQNLNARWLLNLAWMTLGGYPNLVPKPWLIPSTVFRSDVDVPRFKDIAAQKHVDVSSYAGSVIMDDFNNDGHLDLMTSSWKLTSPLQVFLHNGKAHDQFKMLSYQNRSHLDGITGGFNLQQGDFNNDGKLDVFVTRTASELDVDKEGFGYFAPPNSLLSGKGDGSFDEVTEKAGLLTFAPTLSAAWGDYDNDGWLDLIAPKESTKSVQFQNELWHNNKDGTFTNLAKQVGLDVHGFFLGAVWGDYDNDGKQDLFLSAWDGSNYLFHNEGPDVKGQWHFKDVTLNSGVKKERGSFACWFWDFDQDGWQDLMVYKFDAELQDVVKDYLRLPGRRDAKTRLYRNNRDGTFTDIADRAGLNKALLVMGANFGDVNNDGYPDIYLGTGSFSLDSLIPNRLFINDQGKRLLDVTTATGVGHLQKGHGIAFGDIDEDGWADIYSVFGGAYDGDFYRNALFKNPRMNQNHWVKLKLVGVRSNRSAIGARIKITVEERQKLRQIYSVVSSGGSFGSSPLMQHIGLGQAKEVKRLEITWPAMGQVQVLENLPADKKYEITEK